MYSSGGFSTKGMTSSVTATISSPKVVLITFSRRIVFSSTHNLIAHLFASRLVDIGIARSDYAGKQSNPCARTDQWPELLKMSETGASQMLQLGFGPIVTTNACLLIGKCRNVDFSWDERCPVLLSVLEELCGSCRVERRHLWVRR
jgi:hypothetical protein